MRCDLALAAIACAKMLVVVDPPETHGSDSLTSEVQLTGGAEKSVDREKHEGQWLNILE
jgi:hypothetical protein